jgi:hypothetical protein
MPFRATPSLLLFVTPLACRPAAPVMVDVVATNYAFQAARTLAPGPTLFQLVNRGSVNHEVQIYRFRAGISADSGLALLAHGQFPDSLSEPGGSVLVANAGTTASEQVYIDLKAGETYAFECAFRDTANAPRHNTMGMIATFEVK